VLNLFKRFEQAIIIVLAVMMAVVVAFSTLDLANVIVEKLIDAPFLLLKAEELIDLFGLFLLVLIGLELLEIIKSYAMDNVVHVRVVLTVAMIAIARKVIILNVDTLSATSMLGIAAIIVALSAAHYALKHDGTSHKI
jgi:uncharacterized membrane protein (DUF373 family)